MHIRGVTKQHSIDRAIQACNSFSEQKCYEGASGDSVGHLAMAMSLNGDYAFVFVAETVAEASSLAVTRCETMDGNSERCSVEFRGFNGSMGEDWVSLAVDSDNWWTYTYNADTKEDANDYSLYQCEIHGKECEILGASNKEGHIALAESKASVQVYIAPTLEDAKKSAMDACLENTPSDDYCSIGSTAYNGTEPTKVAQNNCRPTTTHIRCSSKCQNGDCVVTYENGCKMRVQVTPKFDPFSNQWNYPSPAC